MQTSPPTNQRPITVWIEGKPEPQGSKHARAIKKNGQYTGRVIVHESAKGLAAWRATATTTIRAQREHARHQTLTGPVRTEITFYLPRPKSHWGTGANAGTLKPSAPAHPTRKPDLDKLERALNDALSTAEAWGDDAQVIMSHTAKLYEHPDQSPGVWITVTPLA